MDTPPADTKKTHLNSLTKTSLTPCRRVGLGRPSSGSSKRSLHLRTVGTPVQLESPVVKEVKTISTIVTCGKIQNVNLGKGLKDSVKTCEIQDKNTAPRVRRCLTIVPKTPSQTSVKRLLPDSDSEICNSDDLKHLSCLNDDHLTNRYTVSKNKKNKLSFKPVDILNCKKEIEKTQDENSINSINLTVPIEDHLSNIDGGVSQEITSEMIQKITLSIKMKKERLEQLKIQETYARKHDLGELRAQTAKWTMAGQEALKYSVSLARDAGYSVTLKELMNQHGFPPNLLGYNSEDEEFD